MFPAVLPRPGSWQLLPSPAVLPCSHLSDGKQLSVPHLSVLAPSGCADSTPFILPPEPAPPGASFSCSEHAPGPPPSGDQMAETQC